MIQQPGAEMQVQNLPAYRLVGYKVQRERDKKEMLRFSKITRSSCPEEDFGKLMRHVGQEEGNSRLIRHFDV
jgi:hypothetical protein